MSAVLSPRNLVPGERVLLTVGARLVPYDVRAVGLAGPDGVRPVVDLKLHEPHLYPGAPASIPFPMDGPPLLLDAKP